MTRRLDDISPFDCVQIPACPRVRQYPETVFSGGPHSLSLSTVWTLRNDLSFTSPYWAQRFLNRFVSFHRGAVPSGTMHLVHWNGTTWVDVDTGFPQKGTVLRNAKALSLDSTRLYFVVGHASENFSIAYTDDLATFPVLVTPGPGIAQTALALVFHQGVLYGMTDGTSAGADATISRLFKVVNGVASSVSTLSYEVRVIESAWDLLLAGGRTNRTDLQAWNGTGWAQRWAGNGSDINDLYYDPALDLLFIATNNGLYTHTLSGVTTQRDAAGAASVKRLATGLLYVAPTAAGGAILVSSDGITWTSLGVPLAGNIMNDIDQGSVGFEIMALRNDDGDVYGGTNYLSTETFTSSETDAGGVRKRAVVDMVRTVPTGTAVYTSIGYTNTSGGPYTYTTEQTAASFERSINGRYLVYRQRLTGNQLVTPVVTSIKVKAYID